MDYKSLMGYGKKKKVIEEQFKPTKPKGDKVLKDIKQELNESSVAIGIRTLKDNPPFKTPTQLKEVGAAPLYKKHIKLIDKARTQVGRETLKFVDLLYKNGLEDVGDEINKSFKKNIIQFRKDMKKIVRKLI